MNELSNALQDIPAAALVPLVAAFFVGLILWAAGRRVLRVSFAAVGLLVGLAIGWLAAESLGSMRLGVPAWVVGAVVGIVLAVVAVILYRAAIAAAVAIILAVASPMAVIALHEWQGRPVFVEVEQETTAMEEEAPADRDEFDEWLDENRDEIVRERVGEYIPEEFAEHIEQMRTHGQRLLEGMRETWAQTAEPVRPTLIAAAVSGAILGLILGGLLPGFSAAVITAFGGSLLWITSMRVLVERVAPGVADWGVLPATGRGWLIFWLVAAVIGIVIQWTIGRRKADK